MNSPSPRLSVMLLLLVFACASTIAGTDSPLVEKIPGAVYPEVNTARPDLPSPFMDGKGEEYIIAVTKNDEYAIVPVTLGDDRDFGPQLRAGGKDFPALAATGLHSEKELSGLKTITGRPLAEITALGRPGGLSHDGFMAADEEILSVIRGDDGLVRRMGLTHPRLARPLFHVLNLMEADLALGRWNMAHHAWEHIKGIIYNGRVVSVEAFDTKGGQQSIFDDGITGAFHLKLWREPDSEEMRYLKKKYGHLPQEAFERMVRTLSFFNTGEMEPQYIMRYGFYEGHTDWRADPVAIAFIFGLKRLPELDQAFEGELHEVLSRHFTEQQHRNR